MMEKIKWKIAEKLDKNKEYCWANLCMWALGYRKFLSLFLINHPENDYKHQMCRKDNKGIPYAYCNKCELNGRFYSQKNTNVKNENQ